MFKQQIKIWIVAWIIIVSLGIGQIFAENLVSQISSIFSKYYNNWVTDDYLKAPYSSDFSKDPFRDNLSAYEDMEMQVRVAWTKYTMETLKSHNCTSLSKDKVWAILYYFSSWFRNEIAYSMKQWATKFSKDAFSVSPDEVLDYCTQYFYCWDFNMEDRQYSTKDERDNLITVNTPDTIMQNCKEFFVQEYMKWTDDEIRLQDVQKTQLWADKYWNNTTDDSPYDIMIDINTLWELLYKETETPIQPVYYHLPNFSNSESALTNSKEKDAQTSQQWKSSWKGWRDWAGKDRGTNWNGWWNNGWNIWWSTNLPLDIQDFIDNAGLSEWNWLNEKWWKDLFYWTSCASDEGEWWPEAEEPKKNSIINSDKKMQEFTAEEYAELVDYMVSAIDTFDDLEETKIAEIEADKKAKNTEDKIFSSTDEWQLKDLAKAITGCWSRCEWLRIDQKASCMVMCACWEYKSEVFDTDKFPLLWPIFTLKFCAVPTTNYDFSVWWKKIISVEEWIDEIYWVVDKLSREWRLWMWVPQHNFLDSTTKKMNFSKALTFTISIEYIDITEKKSKESEEFKKIELEKQNQENLQKLKISNPLEDATSKNRFMIVSSKWEMLQWFQTASNASVVDDSENIVHGDSGWWKEVDRDNRYVQLTDIVSNFNDNQVIFRDLARTYIWDWSTAAEALYNKRTKK